MATSFSSQYGSLSPDVVTLETLGFIRKNFPVLTAVAHDFSDEDIKLNASLITRVVSVPQVQNYSKSLGYPAGSGGTTDVSITMSNFKYVTLSFYDSDLASTSRNLWQEQAEAASYALAYDAANSLMSLATNANFPTNIVSTGANFSRTTLAAARAQLVNQGAGVPRNAIVNPAAFQALSVDPTILSKFNQQVSDGTTDYVDGVINGIGGFNSVYEFPNLTVDDANVTGFAFSKNALIMAARVPSDPTSYIPDLPINGIIKNITDPVSGISMQYRSEYHINLGRLDVTLAWITGFGVGANFEGTMITAS
jgi:hypothetical protein